MTQKSGHGNVVALVMLLSAVVALSTAEPAHAELPAIDKLILNHELSMAFSGLASVNVLEEATRMYGPPDEVHTDMVRWFNVDGCQQIGLLRGSVSNDWLGYRMVMRNGSTRGSISVRGTNAVNKVTHDSVDSICAKYDYEAFESMYAANKCEALPGANARAKDRSGDTPVVFIFAGADLRQIADVLSEWSGETIAVSPDTHMLVNAKASKKMPRAMAYRLVLQYLGTRGIILHRDDDRLVLKWADK